MNRLILVLLFVPCLVAPIFEHKTKRNTYKIENKVLATLVNKVYVLYKPDYCFTTSRSTTSTSPQDVQVTVGESLFKRQNPSGAVCTPTSTISVNLPVGKTLDSFVTFAITKDLSSISKSLHDNKFNEVFFSQIDSNQNIFASKQLTNLKQHSVCPNLVEFDQMLRSKFKISGTTLAQRHPSSTPSLKLKDSILLDILKSPEDYNVHVFVPSNYTVEEFVQATTPRYIQPTDNFTEIAWSSVLKGLRKEGQEDTRKVHLKYLLAEMYFCNYIDFHSPAAKLTPKGILKFANIPQDFTDALELTGCDKIHLDFGTISTDSDDSDSCSILFKMLVALLPEINSKNTVSNYASLVKFLQEGNTKLWYESSFVNPSSLSSTPILVEDFNEAIAKQMNLLKFPLSITESEIIDPPATSQFKKTTKDGKTFYAINFFPTATHDLLSGSDRFFAFIQVAMERMGTFCHNEEKVKKKFFEHLWATETIDEFETRILDMIPFAISEGTAEIATLARNKNKSLEGMLDNNIFGNQQINKTSTNDKSNSNCSNDKLSTKHVVIIIIVVVSVVGGIVTAVIVYYYRKKKKLKQKKENEQPDELSDTPQPNAYYSTN